MHPLLEIFRFTGLPIAIGLRHPIGAELYFQHQEQKKCLCGRTTRIFDFDSGISVDLIGESADTYYDFIQGSEVLISSRVLQSLRDHGATGFRAHPVSIDSVQSKILQRKQPPDYFCLEVTGRVEIDRNLYDEHDGELCEICGGWRPRKGGRIGFGPLAKMPLIETWDRGDFVKIKNVSVATRYCGRKIVEIARSEAWSGFAVGCMIDGFPLPDLSRDDWDAELVVAVAQKFGASGNAGG